MSTRRFLIADDHAVVRRGLREILADAFADAEFGEAANSSEALEKVWHGSWDVVILDITMPGRGGLDVLKEIKRTRPDLPVLVLSVHSEDQYAVRVLKAGASGYLTKDRAPEELETAIRRALGGDRYVSESLAQALVANLGLGQGAPPHQRLSDREFEVFRLIATGKSVSEIAALLSLSVKTHQHLPQPRAGEDADVHERRIDPLRGHTRLHGIAP
jgi:two-component system, NarL family, invasion response regulator UvrY